MVEGTFLFINPILCEPGTKISYGLFAILGFYIKLGKPVMNLLQSFGLVIIFLYFSTLLNGNQGECTNFVSVKHR